MRLIKRPLESFVLSLVIVGSLYYFTSSTATLSEPKPLSPESSAAVPAHNEEPAVEGLQAQLLVNNEDVGSEVAAETLDVEPFMPKMANETLKAELGNAAWKLLHTILARYPENPSNEERSYLEQYIFYFGKVYPCGDCARHFAKLLKKYPPQTSSRQTAAVWGCHIHNKVNERLGHDLYDCSHIIEDYDCGCGEDEQLPDGTRSEGPNRLDFDIQQEQRQHG